MDRADSKPMTLDAFVESMKADIDDFARRWRENGAKGDQKYHGTTYGEAFPLTMGEGEWFENFLMDQTE
jgi:hypothetical protein